MSGHSLVETRLLRRSEPDAGRWIFSYDRGAAGEVFRLHMAQPPEEVTS